MTEVIAVPTGHIAIVKGAKGMLECLSLADYGKKKNVKASFLGIENEVSGVEHGEMLPLEEKWVVTISTQYGCSMGCRFCDVPSVGPGRNATLGDLKLQIKTALDIHPEVAATKRLNVHYARMGEPTFNRHVLTHAKALRKDVFPAIGRSMVHPVVSTMLPIKNKKLVQFLQDWCEIKNHDYRGDAGLQFSINTTDDDLRNYLFAGESHSLAEISEIASNLPPPRGRKYALNFAISDNSPIDAQRLKSLFSPTKFMVKITPIHNTAAALCNEIETTSGYKSYSPYRQIETELIAEGFDVLVFVPSKEEEKGRITCGNAILAERSKK